MVKYLFTIQISGHLKAVTKIGASLEDCVWKLKYDYRNAKKPPLLCIQTLMEEYPLNLERMAAISEYHNNVYLPECERILNNIKYDPQGFEML